MSIYPTSSYSYSSPYGNQGGSSSNMFESGVNSNPYGNILSQAGSFSAPPKKEHHGFFDKLGAVVKGITDIPGKLVKGLLNPKNLLIGALAIGASILFPPAAPFIAAAAIGYGAVKGTEAVAQGVGQVAQGWKTDNLQMIEEGTANAGTGAAGVALSVVGAKALVSSSAGGAVLADGASTAEGTATADAAATADSSAATGASSSAPALEAGGNPALPAGSSSEQLALPAGETPNLPAVPGETPNLPAAQGETLSVPSQRVSAEEAAGSEVVEGELVGEGNPNQAAAGTAEQNIEDAEIVGEQPTAAGQPQAETVTNSDGTTTITLRGPNRLGGGEYKLDANGNFVGNTPGGAAALRMMPRFYRQAWQGFRNSGDSWGARISNLRRTAWEGGGENIGIRNARTGLTDAWKAAQDQYGSANLPTSSLRSSFRGDSFGQRFSNLGDNLQNRFYNTKPGAFYQYVDHNNPGLMAGIGSDSTIQPQQQAQQSYYA